MTVDVFTCVSFDVGGLGGFAPSGLAERPAVRSSCIRAVVPGTGPGAQQVLTEPAPHQQLHLFHTVFP